MFSSPGCDVALRFDGEREGGRAAPAGPPPSLPLPPGTVPGSAAIVDDFGCSMICSRFEREGGWGNFKSQDKTAVTGQR